MAVPDGHEALSASAPPAKDPAPAGSFFSCVRPCAGGALLDVAVMPNAKRTEAQGLHDGALRVRLHAPPVDGKANDALTAWVAGQLGLARREVTLRHGAASRRKQLHLACEAPRVQAWLAGLLEAPR